MSTLSIANRRYRNAAALTCALLVSVALFASDLPRAPRTRRLQHDAPQLIIVALMVATIWATTLRARPASRSLAMSPNGIIATGQDPINRMRFPTMYVIFWLIYCMYERGLPAILILPLLYMLSFFLGAVIRTFATVTLNCKGRTYEIDDDPTYPKAGSFNDFLGACVDSDTEGGEPTWSVYMLWKARTHWTKLATYYDEAEAQRQCDALSQALGIP